MSHQKSRNKRPAQTTVRLATGAGDISEGVTTLKYRDEEILLASVDGSGGVQP